MGSSIAIKSAKTPEKQNLKEKTVQKKQKNDKENSPTGRGSDV